MALVADEVSFIGVVTGCVSPDRTCTLAVGPTSADDVAVDDAVDTDAVVLLFSGQACLRSISS